MQSNRNTVILIGAAIGLVLGATVAWAYAKEQEGKLVARDNAHPLRLQAGASDIAKIGVALLGLVRQVDDLFKPS